MRGESSANPEPEFVTVARLADLPQGVGVCVRLGDEPIALFRCGEEVHAIHNTCPHQDGELAEGDLDGTVIMCPLHGWTFDVRTGQVLNGEKSVASYPVRIEGDEVKVGRPR